MKVRLQGLMVLAAWCLFQGFAHSGKEGMADLLAQASQSTPNLLVLSGGSATSNLLSFSGSTGSFVGTLAAFSASPQGSLGTGRVLVGLDGNVYIPVAQAGITILKYNTSTGTAAAFGTSSSGSIAGGAAIGSDGNIYVVVSLGGGSNHSIARFNGSSGQAMGDFVAPNSGGLHFAYDLAFGTDGNLYVLADGAQAGSPDRIMRYDGKTGAYLNAFISGLNLAGSGPYTMGFGPDGRLYVGNGSDVFRFNASSGAFIDKFVSCKDPLGNACQAVFAGFGPDGSLYTAGQGIDRYNGSTGFPMGTFVSGGSGGLSKPLGIAFLSLTAQQTPGSNVMFFPQLAVGGGFEMNILLNNMSDAPWSGTVKPLPNAGLDNLITAVSLQPRASKKLNLKGGATTVTTGLQIVGDSGSPVSSLAVSYFFNYLDAGKLLDSVGVPEGERARKFTFPVEKSSAVDTGIAIRRLPGQVESPVTLSLYDANGNKIDGGFTPSDVSRFFSEFFTKVPASFVGSVVAESSDDFYLVVVRFEWTAGGFQMTAVPAVAK